MRDIDRLLACVRQLAGSGGDLRMWKACTTVDEFDALAMSFHGQAWYKLTADRFIARCTAILPLGVELCLYYSRPRELGDETLLGTAAGAGGAS